MRDVNKEMGKTLADNWWVDERCYKRTEIINSTFTSSSQTVREAFINKIIANIDELVLPYLSGSNSQTNIDKFNKAVAITKQILSYYQIHTKYKKRIIFRVHHDIIYHDDMYDTMYWSYNNGEIEAYHLIGKDKFKAPILNSKELEKIVMNRNFINGHKVPMSGRSYTDANIRAIFVYHGNLVTPKIIDFMIDTIDSESYNGEEMNVAELKRLVYSRCTKKVLDSLEDKTKLYFELVK